MDSDWTAAEIKRLKDRSAQATLTKINPEVQSLMKHWETHSPKMFARLQERGILEDFAIVTRSEFNQRAREMATSNSMAISEAELMLEGMLLLDPEEADDETDNA